MTRLISVFEMLDCRRTLGWPHNRDEIESARTINRGMLHQEIARRSLHLPPLARPNGVLRVLGIVARASSNLDENDRVCAGRDQIDLPEVTAVVARQDLVAPAFEVAGGRTFPAPAQGQSVVRPSIRPTQTFQSSCDGREVHEACGLSRPGDAGRRAWPGALFHDASPSRH